MFERYNERARRTIFFARYEANLCGSSCIEIEHLLLGLIREDKTLIYGLLTQESVEGICSTIRSSYKAGENKIDLPLSNECKQVLNNAAKQAERFFDQHIGTEHLLLSLLSQKSLASELLLQCGVTAERVLMCLKKPPSAARAKSHYSSSFPWAWPDAT